jgi:hypothetical protein
MEVGGEGVEFAYRLGVAVGGYGYVVAGGTTVDAGSVRLNALEQRRPGAALAGGARAGKLVGGVCASCGLPA